MHHTRYFGSVFPSCEGLNDAQNSEWVQEEWQYEVHENKTFVLDADILLEYILYTNEHVHDESDMENNGHMIYNNLSSNVVRMIHN